MPTYEYRCESNGETLEVFHSMSQRVSTWRELCQLAGHEPGTTQADSPVIRLVSATAVHTPKVGEWKRTDKKKTPASGHAHGPGCGCGH